MEEQQQKSARTSTGFTTTIRDVSLLTSRIFNRRVKETGLTPVQWHVLYSLFDEEDGLSQTSLAEHLIMAKPPLGRIIDRLEQDGWVIRKDDPKDRRANKIFLTQKITPLVSNIQLLLDEISDIATSGLSKNERHLFINFLDSAQQNLAAQPDAKYS